MTNFAVVCCLLLMLSAAPFQTKSAEKLGKCAVPTVKLAYQYSKAVFVGKETLKHSLSRSKSPGKARQIGRLKLMFGKPRVIKPGLKSEKNISFTLAARMTTKNFGKPDVHALNHSRTRLKI
jgi:hypothetical protein